MLEITELSTSEIINEIIKLPLYHAYADLQTASGAYYRRSTLPEA